MTTTLPLFWHLSSSSKKERLDASVKLVGALEQFQEQFVPREVSSGDEDEDAPMHDGLDVLNAQDVSYSIRRLIRGLASPRESSRLGFAVALTELLSRLRTVTCSQIVSIVVNASKTQGSMTGQEERDVLFARLFGLTAVIQSGLLVRTEPLSTSASSATLPSSISSFEEVITQLTVLGEKKSWLRESVWWTICLAIDSLNDAKVTWKEAAIDATIQLVFVDNNWSPEKMALALKLQILYPKRDWHQHLLPFKNGNLFSAGNLSSLARVLKESTSEEDHDDSVPKSAAGSWKPQVHFVWDIILGQLLPGPNSQTPSMGSFQEFFRVVVDESLFSSTSSSERKYWGFQIFQKALPRLTEADVPMLFTKNFMRSWINHLSHNDRYLHKVAKQVATEIQSFVQRNPTLGFTLILQLTGLNGSRQFDKLTKTKTVESILASMNSDGIKSYIEYLLKQVNELETVEKTNFQAINSKRSWIIEQLAALIRNGAIPKDDDWIQLILDWLVVNGVFLVKKKSERSPYLGLHSIPNPAFSDELRQNCRSRLLGCLSDLTGHTSVVKFDEKATKVTAVASDGEFWVSRVLTTIDRLKDDTKHIVLLAEVDEEHQAIQNKARELFSKLKQKVSNEPNDGIKGGVLLLGATLLQQYCSSEPEITDTEVLETCMNGITRMFLENKKKKKSRKSTGNVEAEQDDPEPIDVLVDVIIGFLEKSTAYLRTVGNQVFSLLSGLVQESTIDLILTQLERRNPAELADDEDEDMEDDESAEDSQDDDEHNSEEGSSDDDDDDDDDEENKEEVDLELRKRIEEALRVNGMEAVEGDSDEEEDLMDDDQMMAIDEQLAAVFRSRANEKKPGKDIDTQREATHFKNRVLDLVDSFIKKQASSPYIIRLILPLVEVIAGTGADERQLADKAKGLLRSRIGKLKDIPTSIDMNQAQTVLNDLHTRARKIHSPDTLATLSQCSLYVVSVLLHSDATKHVLQTYQESLTDFMTRKNSALNAAFFQDFIRRYPVWGWNLRDTLVELSGKATNVYRRCQAFQLLQALLNQLPSMNDRHSEIIAFMPSLRSALSEFISSGCDKAALTAVQMKELFKLGLLAIRHTRRVAPKPQEIPNIWKPDVWKELSGKLAATERFKSSTAIQMMCHQMAQTSAASLLKSKSNETENHGSGSEAKATKRKAREVDGDEQAEVAVTVKRKQKKVKKN